MVSERKTQPRLVTEPTIKPTLAAPRHSRMPTCTRCIGCCALATVVEASSAAALTRMEKLRMKNLRLKRHLQARQSQGVEANGPPDDRLHAPAISTYV